MAIERFANIGESTLSVDYTAGSGSITVVSASSFPTAGNFRVRLDNTAKTLLKVTAVTGAVFTVTAEANDGNATAGQAVAHVLTSGAMDAFRSDAEQLTTYAGAAAAAKDGMVQRYTDTPIFRRDNGTTFQAFWPSWPVTLLDSSAWSWVNQGTATITRTGGAEILTIPSSASTNVRGLFTTIGTLTYRLMMTPRFPGTTNTLGGIFFRESATGKLAGTVFRPDGALLAVRHASPTGAATAITTLSGLHPQPCFLGIQYDGTNVVYSFSVDNFTWTQLATELKTVSFTTAPDQVGFTVNTLASVECAMTIWSWVQV